VLVNVEETHVTCSRSVTGLTLQRWKNGTLLSHSSEERENYREN
jgi:hypothetical protein